MQKVFISSTVFDLLDARAEVEKLLHDMRLVPIVSGSATSAFQPLPDQNSIETCLANLRQCDAVIVILSQRYGPSLEPAGFPDLSATHFEYAEAKKLGKPIRMYVRDRLEADYRIHRKNRKNEVQLAWVRDDKDRRLFNLMEEHQKLAKEKRRSNWYDTFQNTVELKALIRRDFGPIALRHDLETLVGENRVPIVAVTVDVMPPQAGKMMIKIVLRNVGTVPAYRLSWSLADLPNGGIETPVLAPGQETYQGVVYGYDRRPWESALSVTYYTPQGHRVFDEYSVGVQHLSSTAFVSGATCRAKVYHVASGHMRPFVIAESEAESPNMRDNAPNP